MKSKIKFNNRTQNYKRIFKILLIVFIFGTCIYLLYFNDKIFVQSDVIIIAVVRLSNNAERKNVIPVTINKSRFLLVVVIF